MFQALSDPTRLAVVERLSIGPASATELARPFEMALPSFMQHLGVLERAGIVTSHKTGRTRVFQLAPDSLELASAWLADVPQPLGTPPRPTRPTAARAAPNRTGVIMS